ncbi:MAG: hypothetical protein IKP73_03270 [Bacteroidales bacterium]|nr:hypothetical protein [Bacteroidales bacterium]MBR4324531.1 hypothetical protein [Bacteroidales bacterium]
MSLVTKIKRLFIKDKENKKEFGPTNTMMTYQPVGYYIHWVRLTCYVIQKDISKDNLNADRIPYLVKGLLSQKEDPRFAEIFDEIDKTLSSIYEYSLKKGVVEPEISFSTFLHTQGIKNEETERIYNQ